RPRRATAPPWSSPHGGGDRQVGGRADHAGGLGRPGVPAERGRQLRPGGGSQQHERRRRYGRRGHGAGDGGRRGHGGGRGGGGDALGPTIERRRSDRGGRGRGAPAGRRRAAARPGGAPGRLRRDAAAEAGRERPARAGQGGAAQGVRGS